ncbi:MAG: ATP phosphoribosyltransferase regulatory subunit, partial [Phycisphaerae bacterium]|nr:ATP phosphoribosyltransferase regulatory subunit [Phycisphaerae bacterium]
MATQQALTLRLQEHLERFGYDRIATPLVEHADLFLIKAGDAAINRLMTFDLPGKALCLRPEFTVPAARAYIMHFQDRTDAVRLQFAGPILHHERLGYSSIRQQTALGGELLNQRGPAADAEIIAATAQLLTAAGVTDWQTVIGHSGLVTRLLSRYRLNRQMYRFALSWLPRLHEGPEALAAAEEALGAPRHTSDNPALSAPPNGPDTEAALQAMLYATPSRGPLGGRSHDEIARRLLARQQQGDQRARTLDALRDLQKVLNHAASPAALLDHLNAAHDDEATQQIGRDLMQTVDLLAAYGMSSDRLVFDFSFTRNLDYYTGIVFEYRAATGEEDARLLAGGGRYDELIRLLGARHDVP